jgi:outer membrane protein insertion porin family
MTGDERSILPVPGKVPESRKPMASHQPTARVLDSPRPTGVGARSAAAPAALKGTTVRALGLACALLALVSMPAARGAQVEKFPEGTIVKIEYEGTSIPADKIKPKLLSRVGQALSHEKAEADLKTLLGTKWFSDATYWVDETPPRSGKYTLIFSLKDMTLLSKVEFRGRKAIRQKEIEDITGLKAGNRADPSQTWRAVSQIQELYREKGYDLASVSLLEGGNKGDTKIVIEIFEGPKAKVTSINFKGNLFASSATLKTHISTRQSILGLFGRYDAEMLENDRQKLVDYYFANGYFEAKVSPVTRSREKPGEIELTFVIHEGTQYTVRNVIIEGNRRIKAEALRKDLELLSGRPFMMAMRDADKNRMMIQYGEIGCIDAQIKCEPRFTDKLGVVDLVYSIEEREPFTLGEIEIVGNERTKDKVIRREAVMAGLMPGEVLDSNRIELFRRRLARTQYFQNNPQKGPGIKIEIVKKRPSDRPYGDSLSPTIQDVTQARMQDPGSGVDLVPAPAQDAGGPPRTSVEPNAPGGLPFGSLPFEPPANVPPVEGAAGSPMGVRPPALPSPPPVGSGELPGTDPSIPGMNMTDVSPDRNDPFPNRSFADILTSIDEGSTGSFMIGVGANSFQGLIGNLQYAEKNFDITKFPRSFSEIVNGQAFRGGGQSFMVSLQAGNLMNFMSISLREPYLFDLPIAASASGYLSQRIYPNWDERRGGGSFSLGRQFGTMIYSDVSARAEEVDFFGYRTPAPANYLAASGFTSLFSLKPSFRIDNRRFENPNSPFMATKGQYVQLSTEQGWGSFTWTKFDAEGRAYLPTGSRPDGTGKRFFTFRGHFGIATEGTPVYERYFAGNFGSLRGFQYRTISPHVFDVPTGGVMMAVGSVEYQVPWNARDTFHQIFFTDFGTVTGNYQFTDMRVSVGTGLKVVLPIAPMPFEFDLAFPVLKAPGDRVSYFNFAVGAVW